MIYWLHRDRRTWRRRRDLLRADENGVRLKNEDCGSQGEEEKIISYKTAEEKIPKRRTNAQRTERFVSRIKTAQSRRDEKNVLKKKSSEYIK